MYPGFSWPILPARPVTSVTQDLSQALQAQLQEARACFRQVIGPILVGVCVGVRSISANYYCKICSAGQRRRHSFSRASAASAEDRMVRDDSSMLGDRDSQPHRMWLPFTALCEADRRVRRHQLSGNQ